MKKHEKSQMMDMTNGPLTGKIILFTLPIMLSGILQLLFNAADIVVVGRFAGSNALAAVGSNGALINLIVNLLIGLSVGAAVAVAFFYGAGEMDQVKDTVHTSIAISLIGGVLFGVFGFFVSPIMLRWMGTPENIVDMAALYLRIYFLGLPAMSLYNFGSSILRSFGDTKRPLYYLVIGGVVNVVLNLIFVAGFGMDVEGVAIATVISQVVSGYLTLRRLAKLDSSINLEWKKVRISKSKLVRIMQIGIPAGVQSLFFSISNVLIQSSINSFGELAVAGSSAAGNIEGFVFVAMNSFHQSAQTFTSQNVGARKYDRIHRVFVCCALMASVFGIVLGFGAYVFGEQLLGIYLPGNEDAIELGMIRLAIISIPYFLCGVMDVLSGMLRGMGESVLPMIISLIGTCLMRVFWIFVIFGMFRSMEMLYLSYPVTWVITGVAQFFAYLKVRKRLIAKMTDAD